MYFSRVNVDTERLHPNRAALLNMGNLYREHTLIWNLFPEEKEADRDFLYRRLETGTLPRFYILSQRKPVEQYDIWRVETKTYEPVIKKGGRYSFNLRANPVVTKKPGGDESKRRKRVDVFIEALKEYSEKAGKEADEKTSSEIMTESGVTWLVEQSGKHGFHINPGEVIIEKYKWMEGSKDKDGNKIQLGVMDFSGILTVKEPDVFKSTLEKGIGRAKAFGCGLLLIKPV
jgi:CRISPR system Cascade subunit CasE